MGLTLAESVILPAEPLLRLVGGWDFSRQVKEIKERLRRDLVSRPVDGISFDAEEDGVVVRLSDQLELFWSTGFEK
jgi:hypothetical protein